jgi:hypothetical protein
MADWEVHVHLDVHEWVELMTVLELARRAHIRPAAKLLKAVKNNSYDHRPADLNPAVQAAKHAGMRPVRGRRQSG